ncbi:ribonuclease 3 isoform X1 [Parasteatoda tepidariorum]|uniref:ribonuclease 3 isoform X1 n=1 Tax=Parasteatoda tepidariorum TaxID=114398 RepID=UPI0039BC788D
MQLSSVDAYWNLEPKVGSKNKNCLIEQLEDGEIEEEPEDVQKLGEHSKDYPHFKKYSNDSRLRECSKYSEFNEYSEHSLDPRYKGHSKDPRFKKHSKDPRFKEHEDLRLKEHSRDHNIKEHSKDHRHQKHSKDSRLKEHITDPRLKDPRLKEHLKDPRVEEYLKDPRLKKHLKDPRQREHLSVPKQIENRQNPKLKDPNTKEESKSLKEHSKDSRLKKDSKHTQQLKDSKFGKQSEDTKHVKQFESSDVELFEPKHYEHLIDPKHYEQLKDPRVYKQLKDLINEQLKSPKFQFKNCSIDHTKDDQKHSLDLKQKDLTIEQSKDPRLEEHREIPRSTELSNDHRFKYQPSSQREHLQDLRYSDPLFEDKSIELIIKGKSSASEEKAKDSTQSKSLFKTSVNLFLDKQSSDPKLGEDVKITLDRTQITFPISNVFEDMNESTLKILSLESQNIACKNEITTSTCSDQLHTHSANENDPSRKLTSIETNHSSFPGSDSRFENDPLCIVKKESTEENYSEIDPSKFDLVQSKSVSEQCSSLENDYSTLENDQIYIVEEESADYNKPDANSLTFNLMKSRCHSVGENSVHENDQMYIVVEDSIRTDNMKPETHHFPSLEKEMFVVEDVKTTVTSTKLNANLSHYCSASDEKRKSEPGYRPKNIKADYYKMSPGKLDRDSSKFNPSRNKSSLSKEEGKTENLVCGGAEHRTYHSTEVSKKLDSERNPHSGPKSMNKGKEKHVSTEERLEIFHPASDFTKQYSSKSISYQNKSQHHSREKTAAAERSTSASTKLNDDTSKFSETHCKSHSVSSSKCDSEETKHFKKEEKSPHCGSRSSGLEVNPSRGDRRSASREVYQRHTHEEKSPHCESRSSSLEVNPSRGDRRSALREVYQRHTHEEKSPHCELRSSSLEVNSSRRDRRSASREVFQRHTREEKSLHHESRSAKRDRSSSFEVNPSRRDRRSASRHSKGKSPCRSRSKNHYSGKSLSGTIRSDSKERSRSRSLLKGESPRLLSDARSNEVHQNAGNNGMMDDARHKSVEKDRDLRSSSVCSKRSSFVSHHQRSRKDRREIQEDQPALSTRPSKNITSSPSGMFYAQNKDSNEVVATNALLALHERFKFELVDRAARARALKPKYEPPVRKVKLRKMKIKEPTNNGSSSSSEDLSSSDEEDTTFEELERKRKHPDRLHPELWFNDPKEMNDGPLCRCSAKASRAGIRHGIYVVEEPIPPCNPYSNNTDKLWHYKITMTPHTNFMTKCPTKIVHDEKKYIFEGFSMFSHYPLPSLPSCKVIRFNYEYTILYVEEPKPQNFTVAGLELFNKFLLEEILELVDLNWKAHDDPDGCPRFHFMPRFSRELDDNSKELLSLNAVLDYLLSCNKILIDEKKLNVVMKYSERKWQDLADEVKGMIVTCPGMKPSSVRVDQLDREDHGKEKTNFPVIVHFGVRPPQLSYAGNPLYQKAWRDYVKYRHLLANKPKVRYEDRRKLVSKETKLQEMRMENDLKRDVTVVISSKGFYRTGLMSDVIQHAMLMPVLVCHLRFHHSLSNLEDRIKYKFKDRFLLQLALTHPSYRENFGTNPDHARNSLTNCGLRQPQYGDRRIHYMNTRKRGINTLINIMSRFGCQKESASSINHNERLEFLGDAVVEFLSSIHLFYMFPELEEGGLATYRAAIVQNQHLAVLAKKLQLEKYMLYAHGSDLCHDLELRHAMANCFEALMGALFLDNGIEVADRVFSETLFPEPELQDVWKNYPLHPLQEQEPEGDRKWISSVPLLQKLHEFEDKIGIEFTHIRLLARALTHRSLGYNNLTLGSNQRLEFLGDTVLQLVASEYLYKFFPHHHEGHLSLLRSSLVNNRTQAVVCIDLGMVEYAIYPYNKLELKPKDKADLLEAFLGALYVDKDLGYCKKFCEVCFFPRLQDFIMNQDWNDPKSKLQQCCLTLRSMDGGEPDIPTYKVIECKGPTNTRVYSVAVYFQGNRLAVGTGHSIQQAEMDAAANALRKSKDLFPQLRHQKRAIERSLKHGRRPTKCRKK